MGFSLIESCKVYADRRMLFVFLNGIASGFPWVIIGSALTLWLQSEGFSRTSIGLLGVIFISYSLNWLWSPLVDTLAIPWLKRLGQRRSWILLCQLSLLITTALMSLTNPMHYLPWLVGLAFSVSFFSATQDVAIDAYRIDILAESEHDKLPAASALATSGWWTGYGGLGGVVLLFSVYWSWSIVYLLMALLIVLFIIVTLTMPEPSVERDGFHRQAQADAKRTLLQKSDYLLSFRVWFVCTVINPLKDFLMRFGTAAVALLLFIFLFKVGEAFLGRMSLVFYKEVGFTTVQIAQYSKLIGWFFTIIFAIVASFINLRYGLIKGLFISGIAMAATNLIFAYIALVGPDTTLFFWAIVLDNFTAAFSTVAFVAFISHLTNRVYTATQYALMASLGNLSRTVLSSASGWMVDLLDGNWALFFAITALMVLPSLLILAFALPKIRALFD